MGRETSRFLSRNIKKIIDPTSISINILMNDNVHGAEALRDKILHTKKLSMTSTRIDPGNQFLPNGFGLVLNDAINTALKTRLIDETKHKEMQTAKDWLAFFLKILDEECDIESNLISEADSYADNIQLAPFLKKMSAYISGKRLFIISDSILDKQRQTEYYRGQPLPDTQPFIVVNSQFDRQRNPFLYMLIEVRNGRVFYITVYYSHSYVGIYNGCFQEGDITYECIPPEKAEKTRDRLATDTQPQKLMDVILSYLSKDGFIEEDGCNHISRHLTGDPGYDYRTAMLVSTQKKEHEETILPDDKDRYSEPSADTNPALIRIKHALRHPNISSAWFDSLEKKQKENKKKQNQINILNDKLREYKEKEIAQYTAESINTRLSPERSNALKEDFIQSNMNMLYEGEINDILVDALTEYEKRLKNTKHIRKHKIVSELLATMSYSGYRQQYTENCRKIMMYPSDTDRFINGMKNLGFERISTNSHNKYRHQKDSDILITVATSPSDHRCQENMIKVIKTAMF